MKAIRIGIPLRALPALLGLLGVLTLPTGCGGDPSASKLGASGSEILIVANAGDDSLSFIDVATRSVIETLPIFASHPWEIVVSSDERVAYVVNRDSNSISVVDIVSAQETGTIALTGSQPAKALIAPDGLLYVSFLGSSLLAKVDLTRGQEMQVGTIALSAAAGALALTPDGTTLYAGGPGAKLCKVILASGTEDSCVDTTGAITALAIDDQGTGYVGAAGSAALERYDTSNDSFGSPLVLGNGAFSTVAHDIAIDGSDLLVNIGYLEDSGGVVSLARAFDATGFQIDGADDDSFSVALPFSFSFLGTDYTAVEMSSNGAVSFDSVTVNFEQGVENILGFAPNNENHDSGRDLFSYSSRSFADRAVFQWVTVGNSGSDHSNWTTSFELVIYADGSARFDYLGSLSDASMQDAATSYGVGDDSGGALLDLRGTLGSPYGLERRSFAWDPATPAAVTEVAFTWEGTGIDYFPGRGRSTGVAFTNDFLFVPLSMDADADALDAVMVYDRATMRPEASDIAVGSDPRAIVGIRLP